MGDDALKKQAEIKALNYFIQSYKEATGIDLVIEEISERPDFVCRNDNDLVGVELARVRRGDPGEIFWDKVINQNEYLLSTEAIEIINNLFELKEDKRNSDGWKYPEATLLVLQLEETPLSELEPYLENIIDLSEFGFKEIWLSDHTEIGQYGTVELFCLFPEKYFGYYERPIRKPFG